MPSLSINNDHGKTFTGSLATMTPLGSPTYSASSVNGLYYLNLSIALTLSDSSVLASTTAGQPSGIILSGVVLNKTSKTKEFFSVSMPVLAVVGNMFLTAFNLPFTSIGLSNATAGDELVLTFNYTLQGAYTSSVVRGDLLLS